MDDREEMEAFARIEWPGVLVRVKMAGQPATIAKLGADRLEEVIARWLAKYPPSPSSFPSPRSTVPQTGAATGRRKRGR